MERSWIVDLEKKLNKRVRLCGWVDTVRDHGKIAFLDLKDKSGLIQVVGKDLDVGVGDVVEIVGKIKERPEKLINKNLPTGKIEMELESLKALARAKELPFDIKTDGYEIAEEKRLKYRYLDLRRPRMARNLKIRYKAIKFIRDYLDKEGFIEVETPILTKATPEGARDFLVGSRLQKGEFYALPQSPQQYKQLLMVAGIEKYFQIARCFRDEDPRADRAYGEFTQLDVEMSFTSQEEILKLTENLFKGLVESVLKKKVAKFPFPRLSYKEVIKKYKTDKPDLRTEEQKKDPDLMFFCFVVDFPLFEKKENGLSPMHHPFTAPKTKDISLLKKSPLEVESFQHDLVLNGFEVGGGSIRITDPALQESIFEVLGHTKSEIREKFVHLLEAFEYGVPPHGGIAPGIDRFLYVALSEPSLREVMAFPMTSGGKTAVMDAPSKANSEQLKELGLNVQKKSKEG
ncbi:aspartate--tRNA ligase [Patescibacteria group bacterium]|nr:aspartate--tRNA ligase [Patescibacteria group bacterium]